ncbi:hypothetical protein F0L68_17225 [Solihabitans fulvus]|uniref:Uncharacterized protein n=1 Tax=Solihabitans fulvus TaxID=1892852 RepID=A0A5B2XED6_9PSEU|nr:hypothetical protein [Solihabitans fulvus]KAA2261514.1 hypothetical protein F0L68_17225 [Solihabitans fulvus]
MPTSAASNAKRFAYSGMGNTLASDGGTQFARGPAGDLVVLQQGTDKRLTLSDRHGDVVGGLNPADGTGVGVPGRVDRPRH